jgi:putative phosphoesterase
MIFLSMAHVREAAERRIGLISDTHGLLRPEAVCALEGVDTVIHAGDIGDPLILEELRHLAPVTAVRGNVDRAGWARALPETAVVDPGIFVIHNLADLDIDPKAAGFRAIVSGHSHQPGRTDRDGVLYVNPGSAGPRRFRLPVTLATLEIRGGEWTIDFIDLLSPGRQNL